MARFAAIKKLQNDAVGSLIACLRALQRNGPCGAYFSLPILLKTSQAKRKLTDGMASRRIPEKPRHLGRMPTYTYTADHSQHKLLCYIEIQQCRLRFLQN